MFLSVFRFVALLVLWWALLWFALPLDFFALSLPSLALLHFAPPVATVAAWASFKRARAAHKKKREAAVVAGAAAEQHRLESAMAVARETGLERRRVHVDCRGVWMSVSQAPKWHDGKLPPPCQIIEQGLRAENVEGETALYPVLQQVLEALLMQCGAADYLPLYLLPRRGQGDAEQIEKLRQAWKQARTALQRQDATLQPEGRLLPGTGDVASRIIDLFGDAPSLAALLLLGMDAPPKSAPVVVAMLFSRPDLVMPEPKASAGRDDDPYAPYWERERALDREIDAPDWARIPPSLRPDLMALKPLAALHRGRASDPGAAPGKGGVLARGLRSLIEALLDDAGLREPSALELGWLVHDCGLAAHDVAAGGRLAAVLSALRGLGCELDPLDEASDVPDAYGETGAARGAVMLAEALIRTGQLQKPVLVADFNGQDVGVGLTRCPMNANDPILESRADGCNLQMAHQ
ncbi:MAG: hypothetical protein LBL48_09330 [Azoarcus sp.]|jgi:hypothetical protein|nr:hypothetical protein [Azoarcus sp.]